MKYFLDHNKKYENEDDDEIDDWIQNNIITHFVL
jgi:hypothetical protein